MANDSDVLREIREIIREGKPVDINTRDRLLFTALIAVNDKLEALSPVLTFYKVSIFVISAAVVALIGMVIK